MILEPGQTFGRYRIIESIGAGGMALVYKAHHARLDRAVALKVLRGALAADPDFMQRFDREAKAVARLRHPHIVQLHDFDEVDGTAFMAMEFLDGGTLKDKLAGMRARGATFSPADSMRIVGEVAAALDYAHAADLIHRDVKPSNIMFTRDGSAVVTDFGIAKILGATVDQPTMTGYGVGTPEYMAPEQARGISVDSRADIYALGVVAYELLTGQVPYSADTPVGALIAQIHEPLPRPSSLSAALGVATDGVLQKVLSRNAPDRYPRADRFAKALTESLAVDAATAVRAATTGRNAGREPGRPFGRRGALLAGGLALAAAGLLAIALLAPFADQTRPLAEQHPGTPTPVAPAPAGAPSSGRGAAPSSPSTTAAPSVATVTFQRVVPAGVNAVPVVLPTVLGLRSDGTLRCHYESPGGSMPPDHEAQVIPNGVRCSGLLEAAVFAGRTLTVTLLNDADVEIARGATILTSTPRGREIYTPALDGRALDLTETSLYNGADKAALSVTGGFASFLITAAGGGVSAGLNMPNVQTYVADLAMQIAADSANDVEIGWVLRHDRARFETVTASFTRRQVQLIDGVPGSMIGVLSPSIPLPTAGRTFTVTIINGPDALELFIDGRSVFRAVTALLSDVPVRPLIYVQTKSGPATVRISAIRYTELPSR